MLKVEQDEKKKEITEKKTRFKQRDCNKAAGSYALQKPIGQVR